MSRTVSTASLVLVLMAACGGPKPASKPGPAASNSPQPPASCPSPQAGDAAIFATLVANKWCGGASSPQGTTKAEITLATDGRITFKTDLDKGTGTYEHVSTLSACWKLTKAGIGISENGATYENLPVALESGAAGGTILNFDGKIAYTPCP